MSESNFKSVGEQLKQVASIYSKKEKSLTDVLNSFSSINTDVLSLKENNEQFNYSSYDFKKCSKNEQEDFFNKNLKSFETLICNSITDSKGVVKNWKFVYDYASTVSVQRVDKKKRPVIFSTSSTERPVGESAYLKWNGLQIIDLDIKDENLATQLHKLLSNDLSQYKWFLGVCKSSSGKGLHIWTKIKPITVQLHDRKVEFKCNFRHKYSYIYTMLCKYCNMLGYDKEDVSQKFIDMATNKPQQGLFIGYDTDVFINTNFKNLRIDVNFESAIQLGIESINWINHPDLINIFNKLEWFDNEEFNVEKNISKDDVTCDSDRDPNNKKRQHYKHAQRWQLANTLASIFPFDKALQYMVEICLDTSYKELRGDITTATRYNKPISMWAVNELNKYYGFKIKVSSDIYDEKLKEIENDTSNVGSPVEMLANNVKTHHINITSKQYLSDVKDEIIANLGPITLLEAGAGYGKTEMIKALKAKTLLILPFTSTIKSKIEKSEVTSDWLYFYGSNRPTTEDLLGNRNIAMTIDKFSRLNIYELGMAQFDYIVLDESHLLFTSSYRDVMGPTLQRLANLTAKVLMMTGTPTGELLFFPNISHIKVVKEDVRNKMLDVHFCPTSTEQLLEMCESIADDIIDGKKILFPTNKGNLYYDTVKGIIQEKLDKKNFGRELNSFYYKKANYGDNAMDNINFDKSIGNNDIIFCTTYLSVGVDICDKFKFTVYFDEIWIPQDIEQFANRLRNNDLFIKLFLPRYNSNGTPIDYTTINNINFNIEDTDRMYLLNVIMTLNDQIKRNQDDNKYNTLLASITNSQKWFKYDENMCSYFVDETTFKLHIFEERYGEYSKQLPVMLNGMKYYGYDISFIDHKEEITAERKDAIDEYLKQCRTRRYNYVTSHTFDFLNHITDDNIEVYKEVIAGNLDIIRGEKYELSRKNNNLYVEDIEILERNIPIVLSLYKNYDIGTIKEIYQFCLDAKHNKINFSKLERIRKFIRIVNNIKKQRLDFPIYKFVVDSKKWAIAHPETNNKEIDGYLQDYAAKYANTIPDAIIEDVKFLDTIYEEIKNLWKIVIVQTTPHNGIIKVHPFELLWESRENIGNAYENTVTHEFFLAELINELTPDDVEKPKVNDTIDVNTILPELEKTSKKHVTDVLNDLKNIMHNEFDYYNYSAADSSNDRFIAKQERTNPFRDTVFDKIPQPINKVIDSSLTNSDILNDTLFDDSDVTESEL